MTAFRLLLYTGARLSEIQTLKWDYIRGNRIHLPDSKTGAKVIPLSGPALEVLADARRVAGNPYVIAATSEGMYLTDLQKPWRHVRKAAGLDDVRIYDLRHTFAYVAAMSGESLPIWWARSWVIPSPRQPPRMPALRTILRRTLQSALQHHSSTQWIGSCNRDIAFRMKPVYRLGTSLPLISPLALFPQ